LLCFVLSHLQRLTLAGKRMREFLATRWSHLP
jgi:hypothetical protein